MDTSDQNQIPSILEQILKVNTSGMIQGLAEVDLVILNLETFSLENLSREREVSQLRGRRVNSLGRLKTLKRNLKRSKKSKNL